MRKFLTILVSIVVTCALGFSICWGVINFNKVQTALNGSELYTRAELEEYGENMYNQGLQDKEEYLEQIDVYRDTITHLNDEISKYKYDIQVNNENIDSLTTQRDGYKKELDETKSLLEIEKLKSDSSSETISELETKVYKLTKTIESKDKEIADLKKENIDTLKSIDYYENFIKTLETETSVVATFIYDGQVVHLEVITKGSCSTYTNPIDTDYSKFNYWMVNDEKVTLSEYPINTNTTFVANIEKSYDVTFIVDDIEYDSQIVVEGNTISLPEDPTKENYTFLGWSIDKDTIISSDYTVTNNIELYAVFNLNTFVVRYSVDDCVIHTENVTFNDSPTGYSIADTEQRRFLGWSKNGTTVIDIADEIICEDTTYIAVFEYYYSVNYVVNNITEKTVLIKSGDYVTSYTPNANDDYIFVGWTLDGETTVDITSIEVISDMNIIAKTKPTHFDITFTNSTACCLSVLDSESRGYSFCSYEYYTDLSDYAFNSKPFDIGLTLTINDSTPLVIKFDKLTYSSFGNMHTYSCYYYPNSSDNSTYYDISFNVYSGYIAYVGSFYNDYDINDKPFSVTLSMSVV